MVTSPVEHQKEHHELRQDHAPTWLCCCSFLILPRIFRLHAFLPNDIHEDSQDYVDWITPSSRETTLRRSVAVSVASRPACPRKVHLHELLPLETHGKVSLHVVSASPPYYPSPPTYNLPFRGEHPTICSNICLGCLVHPQGFGIVCDSSLHSQHHTLYPLVCRLLQHSGCRRCSSQAWHLLSLPDP